MLGLLKSGLIPPQFLAVVGDQASHRSKLAYTRGRSSLRVGPCLPLRKINGRKSDLVLALMTKFLNLA
jgi:hypothetical protein